MTTITSFQDQRSPLDAALFRRDQKADRATDFRAVLGRIEQKPGETQDELARRSAENFVAIAFVQPLLKQLRETNEAAPPFAPTEGEKTFRSLTDAKLAQDIVSCSHFPLVDRIMESLNKKAARTDVSAAGGDEQGAKS